MIHHEQEQVLCNEMRLSRLSKSAVLCEIIVRRAESYVRFGYDGDGLMTSAEGAAGLVSNAYDAATGWLDASRGADGSWVRYVRSDGGAVTARVSVAGMSAYAYDALGRRAATTSAAGTERHVYDESWQVIADIDESGHVIRAYEWGDGIDQLLAVKIGSRTYTALTDVQGTVWGYADERGAVVARWTYDAWGNVLDEEIAASAAELRVVRYRFQGRERSAATGLVNFRMRWYDPATGRWLSKDPIGLSGGLNLYAFCGGNSINLLDPLGWAHIATRPLDAGGSKVKQVLNNLLSHLNLPGNIDPRHAEICFDDGPGNGPSHVGYSDKGPHQDDSKVPYNRHGPNIYDDETMRKAVKNLSKDPAWKGSEYKVLSHNCQDFVSAVIEEYHRLSQ